AGQRACARGAAALEAVSEGDRRLPCDEPAVLVDHVPRLLLPPLLRELEQGAVQLVLGPDELLVCRDANHPLDEPPILPAERVAVERVPQEPDGDQREPPAREVE